MYLRTTSTGNVQYIHNGVTLSTGIGPLHYCEARSLRILDFEKESHESSNMECAVWEKGGDLLAIGNDTVVGWVPVDRLPKLLAILASDAPRVIRVEQIIAVLQEN